MHMLKLKTTKHLTDLEVLEWFNDQTYLWREKVWEISKAKSLQGVVDFLRKNFANDLTNDVKRAIFTA